MPGIIMKEVLFNDGEGLVETDLNNVQRYLYAAMADGILAFMSRINDRGHGGPSTSYLFSMGSSGAPYNDAGNRQSTNRPGLIAQRTASTTPSGSDPQYLFYYVTQDEFQTTHAAPTTNPRYDLLSVRLQQVSNDAADNATRDQENASTRALSSGTFVKKRKVTCTLTVTQGTEAASPTVPAVPANNVALAAFKVPVAATVFDPKTDIIDYRMPVGGNDVFFVPGANATWAYNGASDADFATFATGTLTNDGTSARTCYFHCPLVGGSKRIIRLGLAIDPAAGNLQEDSLVRLCPGDDYAATVISSSSIFSLTAAKQYREIDLSDTSTWAPQWTNGYTAGYAVDRNIAGGTTVATFPTHAAIKLISNATTLDLIYGAYFHLAG